VGRAEDRVVAGRKSDRRDPSRLDLKGPRYYRRGKTTIVNSILRILAAKGVGLSLCAPTGRAAKRMTEASGFEAKTIHRLLEVDPKTGAFKLDAGDREKIIASGLAIGDAGTAQLE